MNQLKEVRFDQWCQTCAHSGVDEKESPCTECLGVPARVDSTKPENWEEKK